METSAFEFSSVVHIFYWLLIVSYALTVGFLYYKVFMDIDDPLELSLTQNVTLSLLGAGVLIVIVYLTCLMS